MTDLESRVRESITSAAQDGAPAPPDAADLLARAHRARTARHRTATAGIAAVFVLVLSLIVVLVDREDRGDIPAASPSASPTATPDQVGWKVLEDSGLRMSLPPGTLVNPSVCLKDGRSYVLTAGHSCGKPNTDGPVKPAPVVIWFLGGEDRVAPPPKPLVLQTLNRDGLSGFVEPMGDPGFHWQTRGASYTWKLVENTTTTTIYFFGKDLATAQRVIDSLRLAHR
ncbi:hypothetical protein AB0H36_47350 [Kribbella sp. NPDC050820]|uniref:hypothetical protein n=1 Tax=Kribbella sp. NPDC050820 TaxID=3155408 RepID=UPI00340C9434